MHRVRLDTGIRCIMCTVKPRWKHMVCCPKSHTLSEIPTYGVCLYRGQTVCAVYIQMTCEATTYPEKTRPWKKDDQGVRWHKTGLPISVKSPISQLSRQPHEELPCVAAFAPSCIQLCMEWKAVSSRLSILTPGVLYESSP